jgi:Uma2 family endonuclease
LTSPADIVLGTKTLVQPDLFVISRTPDRPIETWSDAGVPVLAVEVLSPSTAARDRGQKRRIYLGAGVSEYWIVDIDARLIERWRPGDERPEIIAATLEWNAGGGPVLTIPVPRLFADLEP